MKLRLYAAAVIALQTAAPAVAAPQTMVVGGASTPMLRIGTEIPVKLRTELTTKNKSLRVGQRFEIETSEPVLLNGQLIIPVGTPGMGEVISVTNKGMWGKSGHFDIRLLYLRVGDRQIRLSGTLGDKGTAGGVGAVAVSAIVFLPAGFFMTGTSARMPAGTIIKGSLNEDVPVAFADAVAVRPLQATAVVTIANASVTPSDGGGSKPRIVPTALTAEK